LLAVPNVLATIQPFALAMPPALKIVEVRLLIDPKPAISSTLAPSAKSLSSHDAP
jgi:hypothetical protein